MNKIVMVLLAGLVLSGSAQGADLNISGVSNRTYQNTTYGRAIINNCTNVTIRNCKFSASSGTVVNMTGSSSYITLETCEINGLTDACTGIFLSWSGKNTNITVKGCKIYNIADDGIQLHYGADMKFYDNEIHQLHGCGTDQGCGPCNNGHSDGFEVGNCTRCEFKRNLIYDIQSTSGFFMANTAGLNYDLVMENNIIYTPETGFAIYIHYVDGMELFNNTIWKGSTGGIALGNEVYNLDAKNNIISAINLQHAGITYNPTHHRFDYNLVGVVNQGMALQAHDVYYPDPAFKTIGHFFDPTVLTSVTADDFSLTAGSQAIGKGTTAGMPSTDFYGTARTVPYDLGAIKYTGTSIHQEKATTGLRPVGQLKTLWSLGGKPVTGAPAAGVYVQEYETAGGKVYNKVVRLVK